MTPSRRTLESITLADLAVDNRLFVVRCNLCQKTEHYLAKDLAAAMGGKRLAHTVFDRCPHCGKNEWLRVSYRLLSDNDAGRLRIRRPVNRRVVWSWEDAVYEPERPRLPGLWGGRAMPPRVRKSASSASDKEKPAEAG